MNRATARRMARYRAGLIIQSLIHDLAWDQYELTEEECLLVEREMDWVAKYLFDTGDPIPLAF